MFFTQGRLVSLLFLGAAIVNIITCLVIWYYARGSGGVVPLHYSVVSGIDQLGSVGALYQLPLLAFVVWVVNLVVSYLFVGVGKYFAILSAASSGLVAVVILVASILLKIHGG